MLLKANWLVHPKETGNARTAVSDKVLAMLCRHYAREKQHVMRFHHHAEHIRDAEIRRALLKIAAREAEHASSLGEKILALGGTLPEVMNIRYSQENTWSYLRSDLDEEHRCLEEVAEDKASLGDSFPDIADILERIELDAQRHREQLRKLFESDVMTPWAA